MATTTIWRNWARQQRCAPLTIARPRSEDELAEVVAAASRTRAGARAVGSGHSFTDICCTDGCLIDLSRMDRVVAANDERGTIDVEAGIKLHELTRRLATSALALENQGDVDVQSLAGALATGTHGTGLAFPNLSARVIGCRLVTSGGDVLELTSENDRDALRAVRVSLGALGVVSRLTLEVVPAFRIRRIERPRRVSEVLRGLEAASREHDHYEVLLFPHSTRCLELVSERTAAAAQPASAWQRLLVEDLMVNRALGAMLRLSRRFPTLAPHLGRTAGRCLPTVERLDESHRVFPTPRKVRFTEMEYAVPRAAAGEAVDRVMALIGRQRVPVNFPIELRFSAADDAFLSPAEGRESAFVAVHQYIGVEYESLFRAVEAIMDDYGGRPHWGKRHYQRAETLAPRYPEWDAFQAVRRRLDPTGVFTNDYIARTLGPASVGLTAAA